MTARKADRIARKAIAEVYDGTVQPLCEPKLRTKEDAAASVRRRLAESRHASKLLREFERHNARSEYCEDWSAWYLVFPDAGDDTVLLVGVSIDCQTGAARVTEAARTGWASAREGTALRSGCWQPGCDA